MDRYFHYRVMAENYLRMYRAWQANGVLPEGLGVGMAGGATRP